MLVRVRNPIPFSVKWQAQAKTIKKSVILCGFFIWPYDVNMSIEKLKHRHFT